MPIRNPIICVALTILVMITAPSGVAAEWFPFATSPMPNLKELAGGKVHGSRMKIGGSYLSIGVETYYQIPLSPQATLNRMKNPTSGSGKGAGATQSFGLDQRAPIHSPARLSDFESFKLTGNSGHFGIGGASMMEIKTKNLNLTSREAASLKKAKIKGVSTLENAWREVFKDRSNQFQKSGFVSFPPYETSEIPFHHQAELVTLLRTTPEILKHFQVLIGAVMTGEIPESASTPSYSWESSKVQGEQTLSLICLISAPSENGRIQVVEASYYVTGGYYTSLILYELVPLMNGEQTLAWRGDYVITASIGFLHGIERVAAENIMRKEVVNSVEGFVDSIR